MTDFPTRLDLFALGRQYVLNNAKSIDPAQINIAGSDVNIIVGGSSVMAYAVVLQLAYNVNRLTLDGATDEDLDRYGYDRYNLTRKGASPALVDVRFYRASGPAGSIDIGTQLVGLGGQQYITVQEASFDLDTPSVTVAAKAVQAGKAQQVGANVIRRFQTQSDIFDQSIKVNNDAVAAGGEDAEDDDTFRSRIRDFWNAARRGTLGAIAFGAQQVPGVFSAQAFEILGPMSAPTRMVELYISDSSGVASRGLANLVSQSLDEYRAAGIPVVVRPTQPQIVSITLQLSFSAGVDSESTTEAIKAEIVRTVNALPVNGTLYKAILTGVLNQFVSQGLLVTNGTLVDPVGDTVPDAGKTLRMNSSNVTVL